MWDGFSAFLCALERLFHILGILCEIPQDSNRTKKVQPIGIAQKDRFNTAVRVGAVMEFDALQDPRFEFLREILAPPEMFRQPALDRSA